MALAIFAWLLVLVASADHGRRPLEVVVDGSSHRLLSAPRAIVVRCFPGLLPPRGNSSCGAAITRPAARLIKSACHPAVVAVLIGLIAHL
jgi:hypothetical protein